MFTSRKPVATRKVLLSVASATALLASASFAGADDTSGFIKHNSSQFSAPIEIRIKKVDGQMSLRQDSISVPIQYEAEVKGYLTELRSVDLRIEQVTHGKGATYELRRNLDKDKVWGTTTVSFNRAQIEPMVAYGKQLCASHDGSRDKRIDTVMTLLMQVGYWKSATLRHFAKSDVVPVTVICEPDRPSNPAKLLQVKLGTTAQQCHKPIGLVAHFVVTLPANYAFKLQRDDGATQDATVFPTLKDGPIYRGQWGKSYTFHVSETRKYRIVSEKLEPLTEWVTISVVCPVSEQPRPGNNYASPPRHPVPQQNAKPVNQRMPVAPQPRAPRHIQNLKK